MRGFHFGSMLLPGIRGLCLGRDLITMDPWLGKNCNVKLYESLQYKKCTYIVYLSFAPRHFKKAKITIFTKCKIFFSKTWDPCLLLLFILFVCIKPDKLWWEAYLSPDLYLGILWPKSLNQAKGFLRTCNLIYNDRIILSQSVKE